jgi:hypothetical protein
MARTPSYPKDAPVAPRGATADPPRAETPPAETAPAPPRPKAAPAPGAPPAESRPADSKRTKHLVAGAAIGIGSAALVAALLYANRNKN